MKANIGLTTIGCKLQIYRSVMRRQGYDRSNPLSGADRIIHGIIRHKSVVHIPQKKLVPNHQVASIGDRLHIPRCMTVRVPMIEPLIQIITFSDDPMVIQLVAGIILRDILPVPGRIIHTHIHTENPARQRMLRHPNRIAQPPSQQLPRRIEILRRRRIPHPKRLDLTMARLQVQSREIHIRITTPADDQRILLLLRKQQCSRHMVPSRIPTNIYNLLAGPAHASPHRIVRPRQHRFRRRGVQRFPIPRERDPVREIGVPHHIDFAGYIHAVVTQVVEAQASDAVALLHDEQLASAVEGEPAGLGEVVGDELRGVAGREGGGWVTWLELGGA